MEYTYFLCNKKCKSTNYARVVTIVVLIILAGITLNAVIGEDGIIFQAKDTKNMISNETQYDNEQLAQLQNELKDNELYSGIGIIPGTDTGGGSEGGENGTGGGNQGGSGGNSGSNTGGNNSHGGIIEGETAQDPTIRVLEGEEIAASFYQTNVTLQIYTTDRTQKIKFILSTDVEAITNELYPSGLVRELEIENGGTLTFTADGEYTLTAYAYDTAGNKSRGTTIWFKKQGEGETTTGGITVTIASGKMGLNEYYTSNVTLRVLGTDSGSSIVKYRVQGEATSGGQIGELERDTTGSIDTGEQVIANGTTFKITMDGNFTIQAFSYDAGGNLINPSEVVRIKKDSTRPEVRSFTGEQIVGTGFRVTIDAVDAGSGLVANPYVYRYRLAETNGEYTSSEVTGANTYTYTGLNQSKTYDMFVAVTDQAGNATVSKTISKPALWVSKCAIWGEGTGLEGSRRFGGADLIEITVRGQDSTNVDVHHTSVEIKGKILDDENNGSTGSIDGITYERGDSVNYRVDIEGSSRRQLNLMANGDWEITVKNYDSQGLVSSTNCILVARDNVVPVLDSVTDLGYQDYREQFDVVTGRIGWSGLKSSKFTCTTNGTKKTSSSSSRVLGLVTNGVNKFSITANGRNGLQSNAKVFTKQYTTLLGTVTERRFVHG